MEVISTDKLTKYFGSVHAVQRVSLSVRKGEIYGFLGLNGAGKTTTIRMLLGMTKPTTGAAYIMGKKVNPSDYKLWAEVGYLVEMPYSYPDLSVRQNLRLVAKLRGISDSGSIDRVMAALKLTQYSDRKSKHLSLGNLQRLGLAKAMLHNPSLLILDEPANGLDPAGIVEIREMLSDLTANHGVTVFISSHILEEIALLATRIGIIHEGNLLQELDRVQLDQLLQKKLYLDARDRDALEKYLKARGNQFSRTGEGHLVVSGDELIYHPEILAKELVEAGILPTMLYLAEENLESYFLRMIGRQDKEQ